MLHPNYFLLFEALGFIAFIMIVARELHQRNFRRLFEIASCAVFGMILEIGNTFLAHTYSYGANFLVNLANVPVAIGLGWAVIIYCIMLLSDQYNIPWILRPFLDALTAVILDLAMDIVAIRLGFWSWAIPLDKEWYGVPFSNLVGWILVVLSFSFLIRFIRTLNYERVQTKLLMLFSPLLSYLGLLFGLIVFSMVAFLPYQINHWNAFFQLRYTPELEILSEPQVVFWKTIIFTIIMTELVHIVVWSLIKYRKRYLRHFDLLSFTILTGLHLFFLAAIFSAGLYRELPILVFISIAGLFAHLLIHFLPYLINPRTIYLFRKIKETAEVEQEHLSQIIEEKMK